MIMIVQKPDGDFVRINVDALWNLPQMGWINE
jgi:hypothetical protein